jgi:hypothetical protein
MNPTPRSFEQLQEAQIGARALGVELSVQEVRSRDKFEPAFSAMTSAGAGGSSSSPTLLSWSATLSHHCTGAAKPAASDVSLAHVHGRGRPDVLWQ